MSSCLSVGQSVHPKNYKNYKTLQILSIYEWPGAFTQRYVGLSICLLVSHPKNYKNLQNLKNPVNTWLNIKKSSRDHQESFDSMPELPWRSRYFSNRILPPLKKTHKGCCLFILNMTIQTVDNRGFTCRWFQSNMKTGQYQSWEK